jgi:HK97 family phage portal protein
VIIRLKGGTDAELYTFALSDMVRWGFTGLRSLQPHVAERDMRGIPAIARAARIRSEAVANLRLYCWRGEGVDRARVDGAWQSKLFAGRPNDQQTLFDFWETVEESMAYRGNSFIWKNASNGRVVEWYALHPDQVTVDSAGVYTVQVSAGYVDPVGKGPGKYPKLGCDTILHIRGHGYGGQIVAPSPVQQFREAMGGPIGRQKHESRMWRRGVAGQVAVQFPAGINKEQADQWREAWRANYEGTDGETTMVVGGGAEIKPIGLTPVDAAFVDMAHLTVEDAARIMGVPANLLGISVQMKGTPNLEQDLAMWLRFGLGPELERIESALSTDESLFGVQARLSAAAKGSLGIYPKFYTDGFVRGDNVTEATILQGDVQAGIILPNEARAMKGLPPHPDGNILQITPVGGAPNESAPPPTGAADKLPPKNAAP